MNTAVDVISIIDADPRKAFDSQETLDRYLAEYERQAKSKPQNMLSASGRKEIASEAYAIARKKTTLDDAGKAVKDDAQKRVDAVNAMRRTAKDRLEQLQDSIRAPLTRWETQEKARVDSCNAIIDDLKRSAVILGDDTSATVKQRLDRVSAIEITAADFQELADVAFQRLVEAKAALRNAYDRLLKSEADQAELERLRAEAAERDRAEAERKAKEAAETEAREAAHRAESDRIESEARAAENARRAAEAKATQEALAAELRHQQELAKAKAELDAVNRAQRESEERERQRLAAEAAETARRLADQEHRSAVMRSAKEAVMEYGGVKEDAAKKIVLAIAAGNVPHATINF